MVPRLSFAKIRPVTLTWDSSMVKTNQMIFVYQATRFVTVARRSVVLCFQYALFNRVHQLLTDQFGMTTKTSNRVWMPTNATAISFCARSLESNQELDGNYYESLGPSNVYNPCHSAHHILWHGFRRRPDSRRLTTMPARLPTNPYTVHTVGNQLPSTQLPSTKNGGGVER